MFKRVTWFVSGVAAGAVGAGVAKKKVKAKAEQMKPVNVAKAASDRVRRKGADIAGAVREGRQAMKDKEAELIALRDGPVPIAPDTVIDIEARVTAGSTHQDGPRRRSRHPRGDRHRN